MTNRLLIVEPGQTRSSDATLAAGVGHWGEAIEVFAHWWSGPVELVGNAPDPKIAGIDHFHPLGEFVTSPTRSPYLLARSRLARTINSLAGGEVSARLLRREWEGAASEVLALELRKLAIEDPTSTIFVPTAVPIVVETIVRNAAQLHKLSGGKLRVLLRFASQGHDRVYLDPRTFASQIRRWRDRATPLTIDMCVEVEASSERYTEAAGIPVSWVPWPVMPSVMDAGSKAIAETPPRVFIYANREEQGAHDVLRIAHSIALRFDGKIEVEGKVGARAAARTGLLASTDTPLPEKLSLNLDLLLPKQLRARIAACSVVVMPYSVRRYVRRGSALMWVALDEGVPMIAPAGTGFGDEISRRGVGFSYRDQSEIPALVQRAIDEAESLSVAIARYQARRSAALVASLGRI